MRFELITLGTSGAIPSPGRFCSSQLLCLENQDFLIDCGEGCQIRLQQYGGGYSRIDHIFISHLHGDHFYGLPGLLTSWALNGRTQPLTIYSPPGLEHLLATWLSFSPPWPYPVTFRTLFPMSGLASVWSDEEVEIFTFSLHHGIPTHGYLFRERRRPATIIPKRIAEYRIPFEMIPAIKAGGDFTTDEGLTVAHTDLTHPAPPPRGFAYCSDTRYLPALADIIHGVDLLYHEATFLHDLLDNAERTLHSTAREAALLAKAVQAKRLVLGHYSSRYPDPRPLEQEARAIFANTDAASDGDHFSIPFQGRRLSVNP